MRRTLARRFAVAAVAATAAVSACAHPARADDAGTGVARPAERPARLVLSAGAWFTSGEAGFSIGDHRLAISELDFPLDGEMAEATAECTLLRGPLGRAAIRGRYAGAIRVGGTGTDRDWDEEGALKDFSRSDVETDATIWSADAAFTLESGPGRLASLAVATDFAFFAGYGSTEFDFAVRNLHAVYGYGLFRFSHTGPVAAYDVRWSGPRVGATFRCRPIARVDVATDLAFMPRLQARSDALWMLRDYPFRQKATGHGTEVGVQVRATLWKTLGVFVGWRATSLRADRHGTESGVVDGKPYRDQPIVRDITAHFSGFAAGLAGEL